MDEEERLRKIEKKLNVLIILVSLLVISNVVERSIGDIFAESMGGAVEVLTVVIAFIASIALTVYLCDFVFLRRKRERLSDRTEELLRREVAKAEETLED